MDRLDVLLHVSVHLVVIEIFHSLLLDRWGNSFLILNLRSLDIHWWMLIALITVLVSIRDILKSHSLIGLVRLFLRFLLLLIRIKHVEN